jgi:hypothetical protein
MKQNKLNILAASLIAAFAANVAYAGQIQSSSSAIAHETIVNDAQEVSAPPVSYRFAGDVDATLVGQTFQIQLTIASGTFKSAGNASAITMVNNLGQGIDNAKYVVSAPTLSADKKTMFANVTFPQSAGSTFVTPAVRFNDTVTNTGAVVAGSPTAPGSNGTAGVAATVDNLRTFVGPVVACTNIVPTLGASVKHFANVTSTAQANDVDNANSANEHKRAGSTNDGTLFTFPTNLALKFNAASVNLATVDAATSNTKFKGIAAATVGTAINGFKTTLIANLGSINVKQEANGSDSGSNTAYAMIALTPASVTYPVAAVTKTLGTVELKEVSFAITASTGYAVGSTLALSTTPDVFTAPVSGAVASPAYVATVGNTVTIKSVLLTPAEMLSPLYVFYTVNGTNVIPVSTFTALATLKKAPDSGTTYLNEQDNFCSKPLASLSGGLKIDVRNYATPSTNDGWMSVIRLINPSENNTATVYGQLIHADGSYGNWGQIATLAPRAVSNMLSTEINAKLVTTPATPGTGANYTVGAAQPTVNTPNKAGDRLRISADGVGSLRVQNYLYNPEMKSFIEASSSQAVDFEGSTDRAPAGEGQYQSQDAQTGLVK